MRVSYCLVIEGMSGARKVRRGAVPRRGEWLSVRMDRAWWWFPVLEVGYSLSPERTLEPTKEGCDFAHEAAEPLVFTSLAVAVPARVRTPEETVKVVLPPTRWPLGGRVEEETDIGAGEGLYAPKDRGAEL